MKTFRLVLYPIKLRDWRLKSSYKINIKYLLGNKGFFCLLWQYPEGCLSTLLALSLRIENGIAINCGGFKLCACSVLPYNECNCSQAFFRLIYNL